MKKIAVILSLSFLLMSGCAKTTEETENQAPTNQDPKVVETESPKVIESETPAELTEEQKTELEMGKTKHTAAHLTFHVTGGSFYFTPSEITVQKGDFVKIIFENAGGMHNFILEAFEVATDTIKTGETSTVEFHANESGTFEYYCAVGNHMKMGQVGKLIIE